MITAQSLDIVISVLRIFCSLAVQCEIPEERQVKKDCGVNGRNGWFINFVDEDNHFTIDDINNALATYYNKESSSLTRKKSSM